jgi:cytochrome c biogenesis protein CcmG/thiol:disulfide interchange protein DsbE
MNKKIILLIAFAVMTALIMIAIPFTGRPTVIELTGQSGDIVERGPVSVKSPAPIFSLPDLSGAMVNLDDYLGKNVILNFWATWCIPCKEEMPVLQAYGLEHPDAVVVLGIAVGDSEDSARIFTDEVKVGYPILIDETGVVGLTYHVIGYPTTYFIDAAGIIRGKYTGLLTPRILQQNMIPLGINQ